MNGPKYNSRSSLIQPVGTKFDSTLVTKYWKDIKPDHLENESFKDKDFPPNENSLLGKNSDGKGLDDEASQSNFIKTKFVEWKRISDILGNEIEVFEGKIEKEDVKQGNLGNCYFLSALAALSERPYLIYQLFRTKKFSKKGIYELVLYIDGLWQVVFVDDYFPVDVRTGKFCFSEPNGNELWVVLLEKAWAKVNGGYANTIGGNCGEPLYALTGFANECLIHKDNKSNDSELWTKLKHCYKTNNVICSSTHSNIKYKNGLVAGHAYTVIGVIEVRENNIKEGFNEIISQKVIPTKSTKMSLFNIKKEESNNNLSIIKEKNIADNLSVNDIKLENKYDTNNLSNVNSNRNNNNDNNGYINDLESTSIQLIKLRNPWGDADWKGEYCSSSIKWTEKLKKEINYSEEKGTFYLTFDEFLEFYELSFICHIMYDSYVKCYMLDYEDYFYYPLIFNFYLVEDSKVSLSLIFKSWRYTRKLKGLDRPASIVLAGYNTSHEITFLDGSWCLQENSLEYVSEIKKGFYCIWLYLPYHLYHELNKPLECVFKISSEKEIFPKFKGPDKGFLLIQQLLVDYIRYSESNSLESCENYYQSFTNCLSDAGISAIVVINKNDSKMLKIQFMLNHQKNNDDNNLVLLPPFSEADKLATSLPPLTGIAIIAIRTSYESVEFTYKSKQKLQEYNLDYKKPSLENFLGLEISEEEDELVKCFTYTFSSETKAVREMVFNSNDDKLGSQLDIEEYEYSELVSQNENIMNMIVALESTKEEEQAMTEKNLFWTKKSLHNSVYYGLVDKKSYSFNYRGGLVFDNDDLFIGYFKNNYIEGFGRLYDKNSQLIYEGNHSNNKKEGFGKLFLTDGIYYEGFFEKDKLHGKGIFCWNNRVQWEGTFENNKKHGIGVLSNITTGKLLEVVEYKEDKVIHKAEISEELEEQIMSFFHLTKEKELEEGENKKVKTNKFYNNDLVKEEEIKSLLIKALNEEKNKSKEIYFINSTKNGTSPKKNINYNFTYDKSDVNIINKESQMTLNNYEKESSLDLASKIDSFAVTLFNKHFDLIKVKLNEKISNLSSLKRSSVTQEEKQLKTMLTLKEKAVITFKKFDHGFYIGEVNAKGVYNGTGLLCQKNKYDTYVVGNFENGVLNGYGESYNSSRDIVYKGQYQDSFFHGIGTFYYENGDIYEGNFRNDYKHGDGIYYWYDGSCWKGTFKYDKFQGEGKYYYKNSPFTQIVEFDNNIIVAKGSAINENIPLPEEKENIEKLKIKYEDVFERLLLLKPILDNTKYKWDEIVNNDGSIYIGQISNDKVYEGRGCYIEAYKNKGLQDNKLDNKNQIQKNEVKEFTLSHFFGREHWGLEDIKYYIGYWKNGLKHTFGYYYNYKFDLIYEGEFFEDNIQGRGRYYHLKNKSHYDGEFINNMKHGSGVYNWENYRWEGTFFKDKLNGIGYFIYNEFKQTEKIEYDQGNIISRSYAVSNTDKTKKLEKIKQINELKIQRESVMTKLLNLAPSVDDLCLEWKEIRLTQGRYIGQVNTLNNPQGRGALFNSNDSKYYVGYWENGVKEGKGTIYYMEGKKYYDGNFSFDRQEGRGKYYLSDNEYYDGVFDNMGNGYGVFFWKNGYYWKGKFTYHLLDDKGRYFNPQKNFIKTVTYENGELLNK